jgi:hypothetical protein
MKKIDMKHDKFPHLFRAAAIMTNFLQRRRNDMQAEIGAERNAGGWEGDY